MGGGSCGRSDGIKRFPRELVEAVRKRRLKNARTRPASLATKHARFLAEKRY
jgi:hypothetical protein